MVRLLRPIPAESLRLLVFDLDGTLIDSAQDLANSVNATLRHFGRGPLDGETIAGLIGDGVLALVRRAFAADGEQLSDSLLAEAHDLFLDYYREHKLDHTRAYEGVPEALRALRGQAGVPRLMAVLTNKPVNPARAICEALGLAPYFMGIYGGNSFPAKKPDPGGLLALMREAGAAPGETVMIGDSPVDVEVARNAGAWSIGCTFGLSPGGLERTPPDVLVDSPGDWTRALEPAKIDAGQSPG